MSGATATPRRMNDCRDDSEARADGAFGTVADGITRDSPQMRGARRMVQEGRRLSRRLDDAVAGTSRALEGSEEALRWARRLSQESMELLPTAELGLWPRFFVVRGHVEGERVRASWFRGGLTATQALRVRADLLVRLGETFRMEKDGPEVTAGLSEPLAAMLTLIRSCDQLDDASFGPFGRARNVAR